MDFAMLWNRENEFESIFDGKIQIQYCKHGRSFAAWADNLVAQATKAPTDISINIAKLHLLQKYWEWYVSVPQAHQNHIGTRNHHVCIFQVFRDAFFKLHTVSLSLTPPRLFEPLEQPAEPQQQLAPILFLGKEDEDEG